MRGILKTRKGTTNATWRWLAPKPDWRPDRRRELLPARRALFPVNALEFALSDADYPAGASRASTSWLAVSASRKSTPWAGAVVPKVTGVENCKCPRWVRLEREAGRNVEVMWLLGRLAPDHKTAADLAARPYTKAPPRWWLRSTTGAASTSAPTAVGIEPQVLDITNFPGATVVPTFREGCHDATGGVLAVRLVTVGRAPVGVWSRSAGRLG